MNESIRKFTLQVPNTYVHDSQDLKEWIDAYLEKERNFEGDWNAWNILEMRHDKNSDTENSIYYEVVIQFYRLELY